MSPQAAMPVVMKRDSLEAMGPVVGEELLEAAAEAAKENAACILESSRNSEVVAAGNSNSAAAAAPRGGDVEGVGESEFELRMTELRDLDFHHTSAGLGSGSTSGWSVWRRYDD